MTGDVGFCSEPKRTETEGTRIVTLLWISDLFSACMRVTKRFFCRAHNQVLEPPAHETKGDGEEWRETKP
ncbi:hypothetical protein D3C73_837670 [compost metagenome]